jgi:hypothetical protein
MAEPAPLDVLSFVDLPVERKSAWGPGHFASRQIDVDGKLLSDLLAARTGNVVEQSTPLVDSHSGAITPAAYLRALLGGPKDDPLRAGRIAIGYCDACLDASCGILLAANLSIEGDTVLWSSIGFDQYDEGPAPKLTPFWKKTTEPAADTTDHEVWALTPFEPEVTLRFGRDQYLEAIQGERRRLAAAQ